MNFSNTQEAFVLASLKEFVTIWGSGNQAHFQLECRNGQAWVRLDCQLGHPASPHHPHVQPPPPVRRHKGPAQRRKDQERAAGYRARNSSVAAVAAAHASAHLSTADNSAAGPSPSPIQINQDRESADQPDEIEPEVVTAPPPQPNPEPEAVPVAADLPALPEAVPAAADLRALPEAVSAAADLPALQPEVVPATATQPPGQQPEIVPIYAIASFENCPVGQLTEEYADSLKRFLKSEEHLDQNISGTEFYHQSSRSLRSGAFTHTVSAVIHVRTGRLWESPACYIRKHLGHPNNDWTRSNGTIIKLTRIHQK